MPVTLIMALSADGKIAAAERRPISFGPADRARLELLCAAQDVLVMGAGSLRAHGTTVATPAELRHQRFAAGRPEVPVTCLVTASGDLPLDGPFFRQQTGPRLIATTLAGAARLGELGPLAEVWRQPGPEVDLAALHTELLDRGWERIGLLGGGRLNAAWLAAAPVDRLELTLAPCLLGGANAPTVIDGPGLPEPRRLRLLASEVVDDCVFLSYEVSR